MATRDDFNLAGRPTMLQEVRGEPLLARMAEFPRPVLVYAPKPVLSRFRSGLPAAHHVVFEECTSVGQVLPPLDPAALRQVCDRVRSFAETLTLTRDPSAESERRRSSWNSFSSFTSYSSSQTGATLAGPTSPRFAPLPVIGDES